jgi:hypothetical protein
LRRARHQRERNDAARGGVTETDRAAARRDAERGAEEPTELGDGDAGVDEDCASLTGVGDGEVDCAYRRHWERGDAGVGERESPKKALD